MKIRSTLRSQLGQRSELRGAMSPRGRLTGRAEGTLHCGPLQRVSTLTRFLSERIAAPLTLECGEREGGSRSIPTVLTWMATRLLSWRALEGQLLSSGILPQTPAE